MSNKKKSVLDVPGVTERKKKDGTISYKVVVFLKRDGTGKQQRRIATYTPEPGEGKREIKKKLEALRQELLTERVNTHSRESGQTLAQFSNFFLEDRKAAGCTPHTLHNYQDCLARINAELGNVPLNQLTSVMISTFYRKLEKTTKQSGAVALPALKQAVKAKGLTQSALAERSGLGRSTVRGALIGNRVAQSTADKIAAALERKPEKLFVVGQAETLSDETVLSVHRVLRSMLAVAKKNKLILDNEAEYCTVKKREYKEAMTLQPEQVGELLDAVEQEPLMWQALIHCYLVTGARRGELCGLLWENVDFDTATITIDHARLYTSGEGTYTGTTKTRQTRFNKLPPQTLNLLRRWKREQARMALAAGDAWERSGHVFTWEGHPLHPDSISKHIHALAIKTGLDGMHTHTLRHTAASMLLGANIDEITVAGQLGHRDAITTKKIYAHAIERNKAKAAEALGGIIYGEKVAAEK